MECWLSGTVVITMSFFAIGVLILSPETTLGSKSDGQSSPILITLLKSAHLLSFSTAWGSALWFVFLGGFVVFLNIPRHQFGNLRRRMFPKYLSLTGICCAILVASFGYLHPWKSSDTSEKNQICILLSALLFNLLNMFVFAPMTMKVMKQRHKVERGLNIGGEIGWSKNVEVAKVNPNLAAMNKKFGAIHRMASFADVMSIASLGIYSWYLARKINW